MTQTRTDFGFSKYSAKELDAIMLENNGVLGFGTEELIPYADPDVKRHGWRAQVIGRKEDVTNGRLILVPSNGQTARVWRAGKTKWFESMGITAEHAALIIADPEVPYRFEDGVAKATAELVATGFNRATLMTIYLAGRGWAARTGLRIALPQYDSLSRRRQESALLLATKVAAEGRATIKLTA